MDTNLVDLARFFDLSLDLFCIVDFEGYFTYINPAWGELLGYTPATLQLSSFMQFVHPDDHARTREMFQRHKETGEKIIDFQNRFMCADGTVRWLHWHATVLLDEQVVYGVARDITEQKRIEDNLNQALAQLAALMQPLVDAVMITDCNRTVLQVNPSFTRLFGYTAEEIVGQSTRILYEGADSFQAQIQQQNNLDAALRQQPFEITYQHKSGQLFISETVGSPIIDSGGNIIGYFGIIRDITERRHREQAQEKARKQAETARRESEALLSSTLLSMDDWVMALNEDGHILQLHQPPNSSYNLNVADVIGRHPAHLFPFLANKEQLVELIQCVRENGNVEQLEARFVRDEDVVWVNAKVSPRYGARGNFEGITLVARDITSLKENEKMLQQYARDLETKNAELDAFAHTVAHDLKNPLGSLISTVDLLQTLLPEANEDVAMCLELLDRLGLSMQSIVSELLLLAQIRKTEVRLEVVDMETAVREAQTRLAYLIKEKNARLILPPIWPQAIAYGAWIIEVWTNYLSNAIKYGGDPPVLELGYSHCPNGLVQYWVQDNGLGISIEEQAKLFTPFTQLNQVNVSGHGLGLSIVQRIVHKCNGAVGVESQLGQGSRFWFELPSTITV